MPLERTDRRSTLVLEVELPAFYAEDLRADNPDWQRWLHDTGVDPADREAVGQEILGNIGEVYEGLLTVEVSGEKDSEVTRTPVRMVGARVEDRPPVEAEDVAEHLAAKIDEPLEEARVLAAMDRAELRVLNRFVRQMRDEYTGQGAALAEQAIQEAKLASDEAEKREAERGSVFG